MNNAKFNKLHCHKMLQISKVNNLNFNRQRRLQSPYCIKSMNPVTSITGYCYYYVVSTILILGLIQMSEVKHGKVATTTVYCYLFLFWIFASYWKFSSPASELLSYSCPPAERTEHSARSDQTSCRLLLQPETSWSENGREKISPCWEEPGETVSMTVSPEYSAVIR